MVELQLPSMHGPYGSYQHFLVDVPGGKMSVIVAGPHSSQCFIPASAYTVEMPFLNRELRPEPVMSIRMAKAVDSVVKEEFVKRLAENESETQDRGERNIRRSELRTMAARLNVEL